MKKLNLKKETLVDLSAAELVAVNGAGPEAASAGITFTCVCPTYTCGDIEIHIAISNGCVISRNCTFC